MNVLISYSTTHVANYVIKSSTMQHFWRVRLTLRACLQACSSSYHALISLSELICALCHSTFLHKRSALMLTIFLPYLSLSSGQFHTILKTINSTLTLPKKSTLDKDQLSSYNLISNLSVITIIVVIVSSPGLQQLTDRHRVEACLHRGVRLRLYTTLMNLLHPNRRRYCHINDNLFSSMTYNQNHLLHRF